MRGATFDGMEMTLCCNIFQSTPPVRGATLQRLRRLQQHNISIHAPRAGGDNGGCSHKITARPHFNPRPPCGGRPGDDPDRKSVGWISIHAPRAGGDIEAAQENAFMSDFNPRPPCGGRPAGRRTYAGPLTFQSTPPVRGATVKIRIFIRIFK